MAKNPILGMNQKRYEKWNKRSKILVCFQSIVRIVLNIQSIVYVEQIIMKNKSLFLISAAQVHCTRSFVNYSGRL